MNGTLFNLWFSNFYAAPNVYRYPTRWLFSYIFWCSSLRGENMIQVDEHKKQMGWSHRLQRLPHGVVLSIVSWLNISTTIPRERCETQGKNMVKQQLVLKNTEKTRYITYIYIYVSLKQKQRGVRRLGWVAFLESDQSEENCLRCFSICVIGLHWGASKGGL